MSDAVRRVGAEVTTPTMDSSLELVRSTAAAIAAGILSILSLRSARVRDAR